MYNPINRKTDHIFGNRNANITIIEYGDMECPHCATMHENMKEVVDMYPNDVRWVYRHYPLETIHPNARTLARATECAAEQDKFWEFTDSVFANQPYSSTDDALLETLALESGVHPQKLISCVNSDAHMNKIDTDIEDAINAGAYGTPYSLIIDPDGEVTVMSGTWSADWIADEIDWILYGDDGSGSWPT